jgi:hypothetical protein
MAEELKAKVTADTSGFTSAMSSLGVSSANAAAIAVAAFAGATAALVALEKAALKTAIADQKLEKELQFLLRSTKEGTKVFKEMEEAAGNSALETDDLTKSFKLLLAMTGEKPDMKFVEAIGFAAKGAGKDVAMTTERIAKLMDKMSRAENIDKDLLQSLMGILPKEFIDKLREGQTSIAALKMELLAAGKVGEETIGKGFATALSKFNFGLKKIKQQIGAGENLTAFTQLTEDLGTVMSDLASEGVFEDLGQDLADLLKVLGEVAKSEEFKEFIKDGVQLVGLFTRALTSLVEVVKFLLPLLRKMFEYSGLGLIAKGAKGFKDFADTGGFSEQKINLSGYSKNEIAEIRKERKLSIQSKRPQVKNKTWGEG